MQGPYSSKMCCWRRSSGATAFAVCCAKLWFRVREVNQSEPDTIVCGFKGMIHQHSGFGGTSLADNGAGAG
jgi:hypothetical protein